MEDSENMFLCQMSINIIHKQHKCELLINEELILYFQGLDIKIFAVDFDGNGLADIFCNDPTGYKILMNPGK